MSRRVSSRASVSEPDTVVIHVNLPSKVVKSVSKKSDVVDYSESKESGKRKAEAISSQQGKAKRKNTGSKDEPTTSSRSSLAATMIERGWNVLYDQNISKRLDQLRDLAVDVIMHFCGNITSRVVVTRVVEFIQPMYKKNHYHSFEHAVHVMCNCSYFLTQVHEIFDEVEKFAILYAALIHDVEHLGVTNMALINKRHELAKKYHNQSVAEMNSLSIGLGILERKDYNILARLSPESHRKFTDFVIDLVLSTDIACMYKKQILYLKLRDQHDAETGRLRIDNNAGKIALLMLILRSSDVGSSMQSLMTSHEWVRNYYMEVKLASMRGDGPFFDDDVFFTQQIKYIEGHSMNLIEYLANTGRIDAEFIAIIRDNCNNNQRDWIRNGRELLAAWGEEELVENHTLLGDSDAT